MILGCISTEVIKFLFHGQSLYFTPLMWKDIKKKKIIVIFYEIEWKILAKVEINTWTLHQNQSIVYYSAN